MLLYVPALMGAIWFGVAWLGILPATQVLNDYLVLSLPLPVFGSIIAYVVTRRVLEGSNMGRSDSETTTRPQGSKDRTD